MFKAYYYIMVKNKIELAILEQRYYCQSVLIDNDCLTPKFAQ